MRADKNFIIFTKDLKWFDFVVGIGYIPTKYTPPEAIEAIKAYDFFMYGTPEEKIPMPIGD